MSLRGRVGQYAIIEMLGSGAMGEVYKATDSKMFGRVVALKILSERLSRNDRARTRFKREVEVSSKLEHPHIVTIHDRGETDGRPYFIMEYLDGVDLIHVIRDAGDRTLEDRVELARQVCEALDFAHRHQVVHRDIKPGNIMLIRRGDDEQAKLVDFGIVHVERSSLTRAVTQPGTFSYMSPEQLRNEPIDHRSDLFSLGIVLYELFTGVHPFDAASEPLVSGRILTEEPAPARSRNTQLPSALDTVVLKLLEKDPVQRPQSAREVADSLRGLVRRLQSQSMGTDPAAFDSLDDLNRQMVENLMSWGRRRESEGELEEAYRAFEKALGLAPDSDRLRRKVEKLNHRIEADRELCDLLDRACRHLDDGDLDGAREAWRKAWILSPDNDAVRALEMRLINAESEVPDDPRRAAFVRERIALSEQALDAGKVAEARVPLEDILESYPDDALTRLLLERSAHILRSSIDYGPYRRSLKLAERALDHEDFDTARENCLAASRMWPDDDEWRGVDGRIAGWIESEVATSIAIGERLLQEADRLATDEMAAIEKVEQVFESAGRAAELGAPEKWIAPMIEEAERLRSDLDARLESRRQEDRERQERARKFIADTWEKARASLERAEAVHGEGSHRAEEALYLFETAREDFAKLLNEDPDHEGALAAQSTIETAIDQLLIEVEEFRVRSREIDERIEAARRACLEVRRMADGDVHTLERCLQRIDDAGETLRHVIDLDAEHEEARHLGAETAELRRTVERRRDRQARHQATIQAALQEGFDLLLQAQRLAPGELDDIRRAEDNCRLAEQCFGRVLTLQEDHSGARDARELVATLREHVLSEIRRREAGGPMHSVSSP